MREKIYSIIEPGSKQSAGAIVYDIFMIFVILCSFVPLLYKETTPLLRGIDVAALLIFSADYLLRWMTADLRFGRRSPSAFLRYPATPLAVIDLLSILPLILEINPAFKLWRFVRLLRAMRVLRVLRIFRYSRNLRIILNVFRKQKQVFLMVLLLTVGYIFITAAILFQIEPDTFDTFFEAVYWAVIMLTTVGYGDVLAATFLGKLITILSALMGVAVVALPAGIITAGYMEELRIEREREGGGSDRSARMLRRIIRQELRRQEKEGPEAPEAQGTQQQEQPEVPEQQEAPGAGAEDR